VEGGEFACEHCSCVFATQCSLRSHALRRHKKKIKGAEEKRAAVIAASTSQKSTSTSMNSSKFVCDKCEFVTDNAWTYKFHAEVRSSGILGPISEIRVSIKLILFVITEEPYPWGNSLHSLPLFLPYRQRANRPRVSVSQKEEVDRRRQYAVFTSAVNVINNAVFITVYAILIPE
jgi:hypothetical protein